MPGPSSPRRAPLQARSRARVDAILDAADAVFLEMGYPAATTNHVAARAGTSIGSLYRFFPDKEALLVALALRYGERMQALAREVTPPDPTGLTIRAMVDRGIRAFSAFLVANPGFRTILVEQHHPALRPIAAAQTVEMVALLAGTQARAEPDLDPDAMLVVTEITHALLGTLHALAVSRDEPFRAAVVDEMIFLVSGYLARRLGVAEDEPLGPPPPMPESWVPPE